MNEFIMRLTIPLVVATVALFIIARPIRLNITPIAYITGGRRPQEGYKK